MFYILLLLILLPFTLVVLLMWSCLRKRKKVQDGCPGPEINTRDEETPPQAKKIFTSAFEVRCEVSDQQFENEEGKTEPLLSASPKCVVQEERVNISTRLQLHHQSPKDGRQLHYPVINNRSGGESSWFSQPNLVQHETIKHASDKKQRIRSVLSAPLPGSLSEEGEPDSGLFSLEDQKEHMKPSTFSEKMHFKELEMLQQERAELDCDAGNRRLGQKDSQLEHTVEEEQWRWEKLEQERLVKQRLEQERLEEQRLEQERLEKQRLEHKRLEKQRLEQERLEEQRLEQERLEKQRLEQERLEKQRLEQERLEKQQLEQERLEKQRLEQKRLEKQRLELERLEKQRLEQERLEKQRLEQERLEKQRLEQERLEKQRLEQERLQLERAEQERLEQERLEKQRLEQEKQRWELERLEKQRLEQERLQLERAEQERLEQERLEKQQLEQQRLQRERAEQERWKHVQSEQKQCKFPGCTESCYVENDGRVHDFCGRTHATQYNSLQSGGRQRGFHQNTPTRAAHYGATPTSSKGKGPIYFYNKDEDYYEFTNFYQSHIQIDNERWTTAENYFQAQKYIGTPLYEAIRESQYARDAFTISRSPQGSRWRRKDWEEVKVDVMRVALYAKFTQNPNLNALLLGTGERMIVEHTSNDSFWGDGGNGQGRNMLGTLLMELRAELTGTPV